jgi:ribosomal protein L16 Arg81 hydroxylase
MSIFDGTDGRPGLADILDPVTPDTFFADHYDKKPLHIPGDPDKFAGLMDWEILTDLLNQTAIWCSKSLLLVEDRQMIPPPAYCESAEDRAGNTVSRPVAEKVMRFLRDGASLVANDIDTLTPKLSAVADAFEEAFDAKTQVNLYCSWKQRQAFNSHFDTHDVFALHVEGEKTWRVYSTRMPHPIRHARHGNAAYDEPTHEKQRGPLLMEVTMRPGDILYLPRGWYHDALASSGGTVHMAFGVTGLIGFDVVSGLSDFAVEDELFRLNLPLSRDGDAALAERLGALGERLSALSRDPKFVESIKAYRAGYRMPRGGIALPVEIQEKRFRVTDPSLRIGKQGARAILIGSKGGVPIPPGREALVAWVVDRKRFDRGDFLKAHSAFATGDLDRLLLDMVSMGVLAMEGS